MLGHDWLTLKHQPITTKRSSPRSLAAMLWKNGPWHPWGSISCTCALSVLINEGICQHIFFLKFKVLNHINPIIMPMTLNYKIKTNIPCKDYRGLFVQIGWTTIEFMAWIINYIYTTNKVCNYLSMPQSQCHLHCRVKCKHFSASKMRPDKVARHNHNIFFFSEKIIVLLRNLTISNQCFDNSETVCTWQHG